MVRVVKWPAEDDLWLISLQIQGAQVKSHLTRVKYDAVLFGREGLMLHAGVQIVAPPQAAAFGRAFWLSAKTCCNGCPIACAVLLYDSQCSTTAPQEARFRIQRWASSGKVVSQLLPCDSTSRMGEDELAHLCYQPVH